MYTYIHIYLRTYIPSYVRLYTHIHKNLFTSVKEIAGDVVLFVSQIEPSCSSVSNLQCNIHAQFALYSIFHKILKISITINIINYRLLNQDICASGNTLSVDKIRRYNSCASGKP